MVVVECFPQVLRWLESGMPPAPFDQTVAVLRYVNERGEHMPLFASDLLMAELTQEGRFTAGRRMFYLIDERGEAWAPTVRV